MNDIAVLAKDALATWPGLARAIILLVVLGAGVGGFVWVILTLLNRILKGRRVAIGPAVLDAGPTAENEAAKKDDLLGLDEVDEAAVVRPVPVDAPTLDRQLHEVDEAIRNATALVCEGILAAERLVHINKRQAVRIVMEGRRVAITARLIYNGLCRLKPSDVREYCQDRSAQILTAVEREIQEMMMNLDLPLLDLKQGIREREEEFLQIFSEMFRVCVQIAKESRIVA